MLIYLVQNACLIGIWKLDWHGSIHNASSVHNKHYGTRGYGEGAALHVCGTMEDKYIQTMTLLWKISLYTDNDMYRKYIDKSFE